MNNTAKLASIETLLGTIPTFQCVEGCHDCCGPVPASRLEWKRIEQRTGMSWTHYMKEVERRSKSDALSCPLLADGKCSVYDIRPAVCRVFGSSLHARLICPHDRKPEQPMTAEATDALMDKISALGY